MTLTPKGTLLLSILRDDEKREAVEAFCDEQGLDALNEHDFQVILRFVSLMFGGEPQPDLH